MMSMKRVMSAFMIVILIWCEFSYFE